MLPKLNLKNIKIFKNPKLKEAGYFIKVLKEKKFALSVVLGVCILVYLALKVLVFSEISQARTYQAKLAQIDKELKSLQSLLTQHPNIDREIELLKDRKQRLQQSIFEERDFLTLANKVILEAENSGLKIQDFRYIYNLEPYALENLTRYGLRLKLEGNFLNFTGFLDNLEKKGLRCGINNIEITKKDDWTVNVDLRLDFALNK
ncbi:MAG: hypothetical protein PHQ54_00365 [Candidatus Omnitrophica bacterium]|nr:hypothetical protein [Candidatus Omnitrophota bacterium]